VRNEPWKVVTFLGMYLHRSVLENLERKAKVSKTYENCLGRKEGQNCQYMCLSIFQECGKGIGEETMTVRISHLGGKGWKEAEIRHPKKVANNETVNEEGNVEKVSKMRSEEM